MIKYIDYTLFTKGFPVMKVITLAGVGHEANTYVLISGGAAAVVDPAVSEERVLSVLEKENATLTAILLTHGHADHTLTLGALRAKTGAPLMVGADDAEFLASPSLNLSPYIVGHAETFESAERLLFEGDEIAVGDESLTVLHLPGHTRGSVAFLWKNALVCGDTVFAEGFGRYDLPTGNPVTLKRSLERLSALDGEIMLFPGHGEPCRIKNAQALKRMKNY